MLMAIIRSLLKQLYTSDAPRALLVARNSCLAQEDITQPAMEFHDWQGLLTRPRQPSIDNICANGSFDLELTLPDIARRST